jgi:TatD DNase family protein
MPDFIDIHAHVNFEAFKEDREEVIKRSLEANTWMINVGTQKDTSQSAVELANKFEKGVYAIVGLHPVHTDKSFHDEKEIGEGGKEFTSHGEVFDFEFYKNLAQDEKVVAIGECGLDFYRLDEESVEKQKKAFIEMIELANAVNKPLMLHVRNNENRSAYKEAVELLKTHAKVKGNAHFFAGNLEEAKLFLDIGYTLSFTGAITYPPRPGGCDYAEIIKNTPLDMIMSETDCPYVAPIPYRGKRNEPVYVSEVVKKIAEIKNLPLEEVKKALISNAFRTFGLKE